MSQTISDLTEKLIESQTTPTPQIWKSAGSIFFAKTLKKYVLYFELHCIIEQSEIIKSSKQSRKITQSRF
jgi:hypothetical protein